MTDDAKACEATHQGRDRVSTVHVALPDGSFNRACSVGAELSQSLAVAAFNARKAEKQ